MRTGSKSLLLAALIITLLSAWRYHRAAPRLWSVSEVPVAWWAWRAVVPTEAELETVMRATPSQALFLRAGQFDDEQGKLRRIRAVAGAMPRRPELHLVYNATRSLLAAFERVETDKLATTIAESFAQDVTRATSDCAKVAGLQLDLDVPTRLLPRYAQLLKQTRALLPANTKLSVTGLPTWIASRDLNDVLDAVDFWIPQCYGALIPPKLDQLVPIVSPPQVARTMERLRKLKRPFYAGLPAYGYAILYSPGGALIEVRGDLDPALITNHPDLELIERKTFEPENKTLSHNFPTVASEWRSVFRARRDCVIDGLVIRPGDSIMLDLPTAESLRACARAVREQAGPFLLGICIFRLPVRDDPATLTITEIADALNDRATVPAASITMTQSNHLRLSVTNSGSASGTMRLTMEIPNAALKEAIRLDGFNEAQPLCRAALDRESSAQAKLLPCSLRRAEFIRLSAINWRPGMKYWMEINSAVTTQTRFDTKIEIETDDGRTHLEERSVAVTWSEER